MTGHTADTVTAGYAAGVVTVGDRRTIITGHTADIESAGYAAGVVTVGDRRTIMTGHTADTVTAGYAAGVVTVGDSAATIFDAIISGTITADHAADTRISVNIGLRNSKIGNYGNNTAIAEQTLVAFLRVYIDAANSIAVAVKAAIEVTEFFSYGCPCVCRSIANSNLSRSGKASVLGGDGRGRGSQ